MIKYKINQNVTLQKNKKSGMNLGGDSDVIEMVSRFVCKFRCVRTVLLVHKKDQ